MIFLAVDDERLALDRLKSKIMQAAPDSTVYDFSDPREALSFAEKTELTLEAAFLDIEMGGMNGLELAKCLREISPGTDIIFVTGFSQYALDAFSIHAGGYLMKPVSAEGIAEELSHLHARPRHEAKGGIFVRCFGEFEVFANGEPMSFGYAKSKELLAYLVDRRGGASTASDICGALWSGESAISARSRLKNVAADLALCLEGANAGDVLVKRRGAYSVATEKIDCDYYGFLKQDSSCVNAYSGVYMAQYPWAKMTLGYLENISK